MIDVAVSEAIQFNVARTTPLVLQTEVAECGLACLAMVAGYYGHHLDMPAMRRRFSANLTGMNLKQLMDVADSLKLATRALQCPLEEAGKLATPCILHWDMNHFVVLTKVSGRGENRQYAINDPASGRHKLTVEDFAKHFTGIALELTPTQAFEARQEKVQMRFSQLWQKIEGLGSGLFKLLVLSVALQLFALLNPYYMQWVIDEVLISFDQPLLSVLASGFALLTLVSVTTNALRSWLVLRLASVMNMHMGINLLRHLLRLPVNYFEARHVGDVLSRFGSLSQVRERLTTGVVETLVDGIMAIAVLIMMLLYSVNLTAVVCSAIALYIISRLFFYRPLYRATEDVIQNSAKEQSNFLENIRGIQTIKLFGTESQRQALWQNRYADVINAEIRVGRLNISFEAFNKLLFGLENVLVVYMAAHLVMSNALTVGMVLAFIAYKTQLTERLSNLVEQLIQFKMMRLHLDRIADIALTPTEQHREGNSLQKTPAGELVLNNICFSYNDEKPLLKNINLQIPAGTSVAISGASGAGKTTLMKIMLGLLQPTSGSVLLDGKDITHIGLKHYRKFIAAVMQDDTLLSGSIADNITFFDPQPDYERAIYCAQIAAVHDDINAMTMSYNSMVGDMGSNLSGGQIQRLLLARALYQSPCILFLDEATSHLDNTNEALISAQINDLAVTRIIIAHRKETLAASDYRYHLENGQLSEMK